MGDENTDDADEDQTQYGGTEDQEPTTHIDDEDEDEDERAETDDEGADE